MITMCNVSNYDEDVYKEFEDTKGVIKSRKSKDRQHNVKRANNDLQNTTQKTKDWATRNPLKTLCKVMAITDMNLLDRQVIKVFKQF